MGDTKLGSSRPVGQFVYQRATQLQIVGHDLLERAHCAVPGQSWATAQCAQVDLGTKGGRRQVPVALDLARQAGLAARRSPYFPTLVDFISSLIHANFIGASTGDNLLAALVVSMLFGIALDMSGEKRQTSAGRDPGLQSVVFRIVGW